MFRFLLQCVLVVAWNKVYGDTAWDPHKEIAKQKAKALKAQSLIHTKQQTNATNKRIPVCTACEGSSAADDCCDIRPSIAGHCSNSLPPSFLTTGLDPEIRTTWKRTDCQCIDEATGKQKGCVKGEGAGMICDICQPALTYKYRVDDSLLDNMYCVDPSVDKHDWLTCYVIPKDDDMPRCNHGDASYDKFGGWVKPEAFIKCEPDGEKEATWAAYEKQLKTHLMPFFNGQIADGVSQDEVSDNNMCTRKIDCNDRSPAEGNRPSCTCTACEDDYSGDKCEIGPACTREDDCNSNGSATGNSRRPNCKCSCDDGFTGDFCAEGSTEESDGGSGDGSSSDDSTADSGSGDGSASSSSADDSSSSSSS